MAKKPSLYLFVKNELLLLFLKGIRGLFENKSFSYFILETLFIQSFINRSKERSYNFYPKLFGFGATFFGYFWLKQQLKFEFDQRPQINILIPEFIYKSRREHHVYWEMSRLARGKSTTFTHYIWDDESQMVYYIDKKGKQTFEKNIFSRERLDVSDNPLFEKILRARSITPKLFKRGNELIAYTKHMENRYDLDNYLHQKSITISDWVRAVYYQIWLKFQLSNRYRYDHFIGKYDFIYDFEKVKLALNIQGKNQVSQTTDYLKVFINFTDYLINSLQEQVNSKEQASKSK
ncbi:hypothetical protein ABPG72_013124 [Tetrahymena utriculariae]